MATMLQYALKYVDKFHAVVPVGAWSYPGKDGKEVDMWKKPLISNWAAKPLNSRTKVRGSWGYWVNKHYTPGIGLVTGQICGGYIVIDLDRKPDKGIDGYEVLLNWQRETGMRLPEQTWTVITGSGGYHLYYHTDKALRPYQNGELGVDLRADGSQVVVPPSLHKNGNAYQWEISPGDCECAEADDAVMAFITYCRPAGSQYRPSVRRDEGGARKMLLPPEIYEGGRHTPLISLIGTLNRLGVSDEAIEAAIRIENSQKCIPPLTENELQKEILPAVCRYEKGVEEKEWIDREKWLQQHKLKTRAERLLNRQQ